MIPKTPIRFAVFVGTIAVTLGVGMQTATAATPDPVPAVSGSGACWLELNTGREACAADKTALADLLLTEYGLRIQSPDADPTAAEDYIPSRAAEDSAANSVALSGSPDNATYILGVHYSESDFGGESRTITEDIERNPCAQAGSYVYGNEAHMGGWNDNVSSFKGFGHCGFRFFADANFAGSSYGPLQSSSNMGAFANQASSFDTQKID